jgi:hypothetical protein
MMELLVLVAVVEIVHCGSYSLIREIEMVNNFPNGMKTSWHPSPIRGSRVVGFARRPVGNIAIH